VDGALCSRMDSNAESEDEGTDTTQLTETQLHWRTLTEQEGYHLPSTTDMESQADLSHYMRAVLLD
jgi:hypothetical protein